MGTWISPGHNHLTYLANFNQHAARLREVAKVLGDHGVRLGLEYVGPKTSWSSFEVSVHPHHGRDARADRRDRPAQCRPGAR